MVYLSLLVAGAVGFSSVSALKDLPQRARGGKAYKKHLQSIQSHKTLQGSDDTAHYYTSQCDNFNSSDSCTFQQRYFVNNDYYDGKGPVFLEIGGEGNLSPPGGYILTLAEQYNGAVLALEHRFYGESIPNGNAETKNYNSYLKVNQALGDLNAFSDFMRAKDKRYAESKWVAVGGSYPGALASWYRTAYPDATVGSLSSSGVVNCIIDYTDFHKAVTAAVGADCAQQIRNVNSAYERIIGPRGTSSKGWQQVTSSFHCEPDMWYQDFFYMIADSWSMADQYGAKTELCSALLGVGADATDEELTSTFSAFSNSYWGEDFCSGGFYNTEQLSDPSRWDINSRSWRYQTCAEVSYFNTAPSRGSLRSKTVNMDYHLKQCEAVFGQKMFPTSAEINKAYGGEEPDARNVFYSDFSDDPWQRASVDYSVSTTQPYHLATCTDCGHCKDLHTPVDSDPEPIKESRAEFEKHLAAWLKEA